MSDFIPSFQPSSSGTQPDLSCMRHQVKQLPRWWSPFAGSGFKRQSHNLNFVVSKNSSAHSRQTKMNQKNTFVFFLPNQLYFKVVEDGKVDQSSG